MMPLHTSDTLKINVGAASLPKALHHRLAAAFHFPDYYDHNWDAFDECIRDVELPTRVEITGFEALRARLLREAELLQQRASPPPLHCLATRMAFGFDRTPLLALTGKPPPIKLWRTRL
ncbi:barstar family protein [Pseudomonas aeruginosa]|uniref:barstar family protein n=1 Tax=Pseudomonas aeruginosa TaxID=287 RepID=UPI003A7F22E2